MFKKIPCISIKKVCILLWGANFVYQKVIINHYHYGDFHDQYDDYDDNDYFDDNYGDFHDQYDDYND